MVCLFLQDRGFDESELYISNNIQMSRPQDLTENNLLKSVAAADKERANSVAKIKVVVSILLDPHLYMGVFV